MKTSVSFWKKMKFVLRSLISFALGGKKSDYGILSNSIMTIKVGETTKGRNEGSWLIFRCLFFDCFFL